ncbi:MAG: RES family NAD+ phosphorylase [Chloroflexota bacterium]|nr:RES family NAD+ phosphorylase [Chloroflexota bacterium]MDE2894195.1 RES family NAD+ phosphorylase [Chloroflexota bacterium]
MSGEPRLWTLRQGSHLTRIHSAQYRVTEFNPRFATSDFQGGRFDSIPSDPYAFLYAASDDPTAFCEALLRDVSLDGDSASMLPRAQLKGKRIGWLFNSEELELVNLRSREDLAQIGQDTWLIQSPAEDYHLTRKWASAIRTWAPTACGLTWPSRQEPDGFSYLFFADRCPEGSLIELTEGLPLDSVERSLDSVMGALYLNALLGRYNATVSPSA